MTQVSTALLSGSPAPLHSAAAEPGSDASEDPDSPGPTPHTGVSPAARPAPPPLTATTTPGGDAPGDPLAEPLAALFGMGLALLSLLVPLYTVLSDRREPETGQQGVAPPALVLRSEGIDTRSGSRRTRFR